ncbi:hypothetical protein F5Y17DRAFT_109513 [Xylariaceae sp. FL0594]|nr:hypothetical protein F5Y17DRAFT_109513 [Xylariaceae sp. FL0594]
MSDPLTAEPATPHPVPVSVPVIPRAGGKRASSSTTTTTSPPNEHVFASSFSTAASAGSASSRHTTRLYPPPSLSLSSKAPPSVSDSRTATLTATTTTTSSSSSPPTTVGGEGEGGVVRQGSMSLSLSLNPNLPYTSSSSSPSSSQLHVVEARAAFIASMSNMLDSKMQSRASLLHANAVALSRQEQQVARATDDLRKENDKLAKTARDAGRQLKELGNVQNWAELLEMDFLAIEETLRLVREGGTHSDCDESCCSGSYWSSSSGSEGEEGDEGDGSDGSEVEDSTTTTIVGIAQGSVERRLEQEPEGNNEGNKGKDKGKGKEVDRTRYDLPPPPPPCSFSDPPSPSPAVPGTCAGSATVSLDEALLESLTDALATDMRIGSSSSIMSTEGGDVST